MDVIPTDIILHQQSRTLEVVFASGERFRLPFEYLRVFSPSAEVRGHGQPILVLGKEDVTITAIEPCGNYGIKPTFDDGHATGIYSWKTLYDLGIHQAHNWENYLERVRHA